MASWTNVGSIAQGAALSFIDKVNGTNLLTFDSEDNRVEIGSFLGFGALETPTIASGVLTVTKSLVNPLPESSTADQVDSIVAAGAQAGDLLIIHVPATNTITFDDANINLGAATRAVAPGGTLALIFDGTQWSEVLFTAATDNA